MTLHPPTIPLEDQVAELERELALRHRHWPKKIAQGGFDRRTCDERVGRLNAAIATLKAVADLPAEDREKIRQRIRASETKGMPTWPNR